MLERAEIENQRKEMIVPIARDDEGGDDSRVAMIAKTKWPGVSPAMTDVKFGR